MLSMYIEKYPQGIILGVLHQAADLGELLINWFNYSNWPYFMVGNASHIVFVCLQG